VESKGKWRRVVEGKVIIRSNLAQLITQKSEQDGVPLSQYRLSQETGIALNTVKRYLREAPASFDNNVVSAFCEYFQCQVGDLLIVEGKDAEQASDKKD
jgi:DNA-binding Xre family transcriptional regulator